MMPADLSGHDDLDEVRSRSHSRSSFSASFARRTLEEEEPFLHVAHGHVGDVGRHVAFVEIARHVLQFDGDGAADELGHDGGHVLDGVLAVEFVDRELTQDVRRLLLATTLQFVDDLGQ